MSSLPGKLSIRGFCWINEWGCGNQAQEVRAETGLRSAVAGGEGEWTELTWWWVGAGRGKAAVQWPWGGRSGHVPGMGRKPVVPGQEGSSGIAQRIHVAWEHLLGFHLESCDSIFISAWAYTPCQRIFSNLGLGLDHLPGPQRLFLYKHI